MTIPRYRIIRDPDFGFGVPLLGRLLGRRGPVAELLEDYVYDYGTIPKGYRWNGNSIPAILWGPPFNYQPWGVNIIASLTHDFECDVGMGGSKWLVENLHPLPAPLPYDVVHFRFYQQCLAAGMPPSRARVWGKAVAWFGPRWKTL
jgi:hypothetical protein